jgi:large subunit ribosomal protein L1
MDTKNISEAIQKLKADSKKRKFTQRFDLIVNLKALDLKKVENQVDFYVTLPNGLGKKLSICALVGPELREEAKVCDESITLADFEDYQKDKKKVKAIAEKHDYFIAQANVMPKVAATFGRVLGPRKKMPNPKAGCVVPPKANLAQLYERLQKIVRVSAKTALAVQVVVGSESMKEDEIIENIQTVYEQLLHHLPNEKHNIKSVLLKMTMSKAEKIE